MLGTRPDITFIVSKYSKYIAKLNTFYIKAVKQIFRYLITIIDLKLVYKKGKINL